MTQITEPCLIADQAFSADVDELRRILNRRVFEGQRAKGNRPVEVHVLDRATPLPFTDGSLVPFEWPIEATGKLRYGVAIATWTVAAFKIGCRTRWDHGGPINPAQAALLRGMSVDPRRLPNFQWWEPEGTVITAASAQDAIDLAGHWARELRLNEPEATFEADPIRWLQADYHFGTTSLDSLVGTEVEPSYELF